ADPAFRAAEKKSIQDALGRNVDLFKTLDITSPASPAAAAGHEQSRTQDRGAQHRNDHRNPAVDFQLFLRG
ncbi:MAG: hypothetical protein ABIY70_00510, partial [Capsulimonas sp.]|uniref:hypothetical protein n=1 Tax=Capsulimonas sp. TaxID=2494211 RepID=UPI0032639888